jgi:hypothetical protein
LETWLHRETPAADGYMGKETVKTIGEYGQVSETSMKERVVSEENRVKLSNFRVLFLSINNVRYLDSGGMNISTVEQ